jgi:hypothetical protein
MTRQIASILCMPLLAMLCACDAAVEAGEALLSPAEPVVEARRCSHCGWIESKREIPPAAADPHAARSYEYTVRMSDGSSSVFEQALPTSWRLRERLTVIGAPHP